MPDIDRTRDGRSGGRAGLAMLCTLAAGLWWTPAAATSCLEQVRSLADEYNLSIDPPDAEGGTAEEPLSGEEMGRTGGLIEPSQGSSEMLVEPPASGANGMQTVPEPADRPAQGLQSGSASLETTDLVILESVLIAARAEAEHGSEVDCYERLSEAQSIIQGRK